jgi:hypothetical protein
MKKRVFETCNKLAEKDIKPTLIAVRTELGGGSFSTINPFFKQWKEENKMNGSQATIELRHELASINRKAIDMMWTVFSNYYNKQQNELVALRIYATQADATITKLRKELDTVKKEKVTLEGLLMMYYKNLKNKSSSKSFMP